MGDHSTSLQRQLLCYTYIKILLQKVPQGHLVTSTVYLYAPEKKNSNVVAPFFINGLNKHSFFKLKANEFSILNFHRSRK